MHNNESSQTDFAFYDLNGIALIVGSPDRAVQMLGERVSNQTEQTGGSVYFVNVHTWTLAQENQEFFDLLKRGTYCFPDGKPLVWAAHSRGAKTMARICGPDFMALFITRWGTKITSGCIGGHPGQVKQLSKNFGVKMTAYSPPHREFNVSNAHEDWSSFLSVFQNEHGGNSYPQVVWVCLGAPKQEQWIDEIVKIAPKSILFFGVGAALDFLAGTKTRAPKWMQNLGLEWLHRFVNEPSRLGRRYFETNMKFLKHISKTKR